MPASDNDVRDMLASYFELDDEIKALEEDAGILRKKLYAATIDFGGAYKIDHLASLKIVPASVSHSYDTAGIDALVADLLRDGEIHTAQRLATLRKETKRAESLRITGLRGK